MILRALRQAKLLTQRQLADRSGIALRTISGIERGCVCPRMSTRRRILRALGVPFGQHADVFGPMK